MVITRYYADIKFQVFERGFSDFGTTELMHDAVTRHKAFKSAVSYNFPRFTDSTVTGLPQCRIGIHSVRRLLDLVLL